MEVWQTKIYNASFRGVPFTYSEQVTKGGRRNAKHIYPQKDTQYIEDMGKRPTEFTLNVYVIGDDFDVQRNALMKALDQKGSGTLIHPTYGALNVCVDEWSIKESADKGRITEFKIDFIESGLKSFPSAGIQTSQAVIAASSTLQQSALNSFSNNFNVSGYSYIVSSVEDNVSNFGDTLNTFSSYLFETANFAMYAASLINGLPGSLVDAFGLGTLVMSLVTLFSALDQFGKLAQPNSGQTGGTDPDTSFTIGNALITNYVPVLPIRVGVGIVSPTGVVTATRQRQADAVNTLNKLIAIAGVTLLGTAATVKTYNDYASVDADRTTITNAIDDLMLDPSLTFDETEGLRLFRACVINDLNTRAAQAPKVFTTTFGGNLPSMLVAQMIYQDATQRDTLVARNATSNPLFMPVNVEAITLSN